MLTKTFFTTAATFGLLASFVDAHMKISSPVPYGNDTLTNAPLAADGSDFPCKQRSGVYDITKMNDMAVGVPQTLSFIGSAVHGGGSCQVSVTLDKTPTKSSKWKVIDSILGGCPSNVSGNLPEDANGSGAAVFHFSLPKDMPNGQYSLAWTWFNKIGNREMYMNCAPITVSGGADNDDALNALPDMFVANIGNGCGTTEDEDFDFPNPGPNVQTIENTALGSKTSGNCAAATGGSNSPSGYGSSQASPTTSSGYGGSAGSPSAYGVGSSANPSNTASDGSGGEAGAGVGPPSAYGGGYSAAPSNAAQAAPSYAAQSQAPNRVATETTMATVTLSSSADTGAAPSTGPASANANGATSDASGSDASSASEMNGTSSGSSSGSCQGGSVSCSSSGSIVCIGSDQWGTCDNGCAVPMALAEGTTCSGGTISKRQVTKHLRRHSVRAHKR